MQKSSISPWGRWLSNSGLSRSQGAVPGRTSAFPILSNFYTELLVGPLGLACRSCFLYFSQMRHFLLLLVFGPRRSGRDDAGIQKLLLGWGEKGGVGVGPSDLGDISKMQKVRLRVGQRVLQWRGE